MSVPQARRSRSFYGATAAAPAAGAALLLCVALPLAALAQTDTDKKPTPRPGSATASKTVTSTTVHHTAVTAKGKKKTTVTTTHKVVKKVAAPPAKPVKKAAVKPVPTKPGLGKRISAPVTPAVVIQHATEPDVKPAAPAPAPILAPVPAAPAAVRPPSMAHLDTPYPVSGCALRLTKTEFTDHELPNLFGANPPDAGTHYVLFTVQVRNDGAAPVVWSFDRFHPDLRTDQAPDTALRAINLLTGSNGKFEKQPIQPGEEKTLRFHFQVPLNAHLKSLTITGGPGEEYVFDLTDVH